jgi:hypothetical protein
MAKGKSSKDKGQIAKKIFDIYINKIDTAIIKIKISS